MEASYKRVCPDCEGNGKKVITILRRAMVGTCSRCQGTGISIEKIVIPANPPSKEAS